MDGSTPGMKASSTRPQALLYRSDGPHPNARAPGQLTLWPPKALSTGLQRPDWDR